MDNLSVAIGILAPVVVVLIIVAGLRAIIRADRREKEFMAAPDPRDDREDGPSVGAERPRHDDEQRPPSTTLAENERTGEDDPK
jgi:hypothetical protein